MRISSERVGIRYVEGTLPLTDLNVADPDPMRLGPPGHRIPPLLRKNIITSVEAENMFKMYSLFGSLEVFSDLLTGISTG